jgi:hypothetical protein
MLYCVITLLLRNAFSQLLAGGFMLAKCHNPSCSNSFRSLTDGKLFRLDNDPSVKPSRFVTEYFWLCPMCTATVTLCISTEGEVIPVPLVERVHGSRSLVTNRHNGLLLTEVSFFGRKDMTMVAHDETHLLP